MFSCKYDGYEEESSSNCSSPISKGSSFNEDADRFEILMKDELNAEVLSLTQKSLPTEKPLGDDIASAEASKPTPEEIDDALLYDPEEDDNNAEWIKKYQSVNHGCSSDVSRTDAVLNCPGCMSLLSMTCQRHEHFKTQYRTLFTFNCKVDESEVLHLPGNQPASESVVSTVKFTNRDSVSERMERFHKVLCDVCESPVGLRDSKGVYHLFNILASHS